MSASQGSVPRAPDGRTLVRYLATFVVEDAAGDLGYSSTDHTGALPLTLARVRELEREAGAAVDGTAVLLNIIVLADAGASEGPRP